MNVVYGEVSMVDLQLAIDEGRIRWSDVFSLVLQTEVPTLNTSADGTRCMLTASEEPNPALGNMSNAEYLKIRAAQEGIGYTEHNAEQARAVVSDQTWKTP